MIQQQLYRVAIYCRLSRDDIGVNESVSIQSQKQMLTRFANENGWNIVDIYCDDGWSGLNFDRPEFTRMISDIELGKINMVITKDLSRLGRDYLMTGYYMDVYFIEKNIRYIAVNDNIDTIKKDNDMAAFKNVINDFYCKQTSKKVRDSIRSRAMSGLFRGTSAPFGYKKSEYNHNQLIIDEEAAAIVKRIFDLALSGLGTKKISTMLKNDKILTPAAYNCIKGNNNYKHFLENMPAGHEYNWSLNIVLRILKSPTYKGTLKALHTGTLSYKNKKRILKPQSEWVIVDDVHEAIVTPEEWDEVQNKIESRKKYKNSEYHIFAGLIRCGECGGAMGLIKYDKVTKKHIRHYESFRCNYHAKNGEGYCIPNHIMYDKLYDIVLKDLRYCVSQTITDKEAILNRLIESKNKYSNEKGSLLKERLNERIKRQKQIDILFAKLYEDNALGKLDSNTYMMLFERFKQEKDIISKDIENLEIQIKKDEYVQDGMEKWIQKIEEYANFEELTMPLLNDLIECIYVHGVNEEDGQKQRKITIVYKFIGSLK